MMALGAALRKAVAMKLSQLAARQARPQVQAVHILAHHILQSALPLKANQCLRITRNAICDCT